MEITLKDLYEKKHMKLEDTDILATLTERSFERLFQSYDKWLIIMKHINVIKSFLMSVYNVLPYNTRVWTHVSSTSLDRVVLRLVFSINNEEYVIEIENADSKLFSFYNDYKHINETDLTMNDVKALLEREIPCGDKTLSDI